MVKDCKQSRLILCLVILSLSLAIRSGFLLLYGSENQIYDSLADQWIYIDLAQSIAQGRGFVVSTPTFVADADVPTSIESPAYPFLVSLFFSLFGATYQPVRWAQAIISACTSVIAALIGWSCAKPRIGWVGGILCACYLPFVMYVRPIMPETLYIFLVALNLLYTYLVTRRPSPLNFLVWGLIAGMTYLTRPEIVAYILVLGLYVLWTVQKDMHVFSLQWWLQHIGTAALGVLIIVLPWVIRDYQVHHELILVPNKRWGIWEENWLRYMRESSPVWRDMKLPERTALADWAKLSETERDQRLAAQNASFVKKHPLLFSKYALSRVVRSYPLIPREELPPPFGWNNIHSRVDDGYGDTSLDDVPHYVTPAGKLRVWSFRAILLLWVAGAVLSLRKKQWNLLPLVLMVLVNVLIAALVNSRERYRLQIDICLIVMTSWLLVYAQEAIIPWVGRQPRAFISAKKM